MMMKLMEMVMNGVLSMSLKKIHYLFALAFLFSHSLSGYAATLYMPEGYIGDGVDEFIAILNSGSNTATGTATVYYEDGTFLSFDVSFPAQRRTGITVKDQGVEWNRPFSTVIETDFPITATLIHYDNGNALGANFTPVTSKTWSISEGYDSNDTRDYVAIFNPTDHEVEATLKVLSSGSDAEFSLRIGAKSRFSVNLHEFLASAEVYQFAWFKFMTPYGIYLQADNHIVASLSHYDSNLGGGSLMLGHPNIGHYTGSVAEGWHSEQSLEFANIMNLNEYPIHVTLTAHYNDGISHILDTIYVSNLSRVSYVVSDATLMDKGYMLEYKAASAGTNPTDPSAGVPANAVVDFIHFDNSGLNAVNFQNQGKRHWEFAEGFRGGAVGQVREYLLLYNPSNSTATVDVTLIYDDGENPTTIPVTIDPLTKTGLALHEDERIRDREGGIWYGTVVDSDVPIIPYFTHYDLNFGGSFALSGTGRN